MCARREEEKKYENGNILYKGQKIFLTFFPYPSNVVYMFGILDVLLLLLLCFCLFQLLPLLFLHHHLSLARNIITNIKSHVAKICTKKIFSIEISYEQIHNKSNLL